jgi:hypothetical protein
MTSIERPRQSINKMLSITVNRNFGANTLQTIRCRRKCPANVMLTLAFNMKSKSIPLKCHERTSALTLRFQIIKRGVEMVNKS